VKAFAALVGRDLRLTWRQRGEALTGVAFFVLAAVLFPFGIGPDAPLLQRIAPGVVWVAALFAVVLSLDRPFHADHEDGTLEQLALAALPLPLLVLAKALVHWLTAGLPLVLAAPLIALMYNLPAELLPPLLAALLLGTPTLSLLGVTVAAATLGARRGSILIPLLALPLFVPVLIVGVLAVEAAAEGLVPRQHLLLLGAGLLLALPLALLAGGAALRQALEEG